jgi:hypothetical protein
MKGPKSLRAEACGTAQLPLHRLVEDNLRVLRRGLEATLAEPGAQVRIAGEALDRGGEGVGVAGLEQEAVLPVAQVVG